MIIEHYVHETPMGDLYETSVELEYDSDDQPFVRVTQDNSLRPDEPDEVIIDYVQWMRITQLINEAGGRK